MSEAVLNNGVGNQIKNGHYTVFAANFVLRRLAAELLDAGGVKEENTPEYKEQHLKYCELLEHYYITEFSTQDVKNEESFAEFAKVVAQKILKMRG